LEEVQWGSLVSWGMFAVGLVLVYFKLDTRVRVWERREIKRSNEFIDKSLQELERMELVRREGGRFVLGINDEFFELLRGCEHLSSLRKLLRIVDVVQKPSGTRQSEKCRQAEKGQRRFRYSLLKRRMLQAAADVRGSVEVECSPIVIILRDYDARAIMWFGRASMVSLLMVSIVDIFEVLTVLQCEIVSLFVFALFVGTVSAVVLSIMIQQHLWENWDFDQWRNEMLRGIRQCIQERAPSAVLLMIRGNGR